MFEVRKGRGILFTGSHVPGKKIKSEVQAGDDVVLHIGDEQVLVRAIESSGPNRWRGTVYGFEPSFATEFGGISVDDDIEFNEENIFDCSGI